MSVAGLTELKFDVESGEWPIREVTVYDDQAEVRRNVSFVPTTAGSTVVSLKGIPTKFVHESIRAEVLSKNARLVEVSTEFKRDYGTRDVKIDEEIKELNVQVQRLSKRVARAQFKQTKVAQHQESVFNALSANVVEVDQTALQPDVFNKVSEAGLFYERLKQKVADELNSANAELAKVYADIAALTQKQNKNVEVKDAWVAKVLIEVPEQVLKKNRSVELDLFYLVKGASWRAKYDIRVEKQQDLSQLGYFGEVVNSTGEDWVEVDVALSTAKPSVGGALPKFPRLLLDIYKPQPQVQIRQEEQKMQVQQNFSAINNLLEGIQGRQRSMAAIPQFASNMRRDYGGGGPLLSLARPAIAPPPPPAFAFEKPPETTVASGDAGSTLFKMQRLTSIESDSKPHKQTIAVIELKSTFTHAASPKVSPDVFMKLNSENETNYVFLPGTLSVFIDGSFSSESRMELVRPRQEFALFIGVDDTIKLTFGPENIKEKTTGGGMMGGAKKTVRSVQRDVTVVNNGNTLINLCVYMQLPFSKTSKIKVTLKSPDLKKQDEYKYSINSFNNLETRTRLDVGKKFVLDFKYALEWPEGEILELQERRD